MLKQFLFLFTLCSACAAQTTGSVNGVPGQSITNMGATATAGAGGVTVNTLVAPDTSAPTKFITAASGGCGSGVALSTAAAGASFTLSDALGTLLVKTDSGGAVAGHLLVGSTVTAGLVMDSGQTSSLNISEETPVCGTALTTVSGGALVTMNPRSRGSYGHKVDQMNGSALPVSAPVVATNASGQLVAPGGQAANTVYANCTSSSGAPGFCAITSAMVPNNAASTTGNAATATALAATPSLCSSGQAPTGVLANGNATGCAAPTVATMAASGTGHGGGSVPDPGASAGSTRFLREDATFAVPAGGNGQTFTALVGISSGIASGGTRYGGPNLGATSANSEDNYTVPMTVAGTAKNLSVTASATGTQPSSGSLVCTVRKNEAATAIAVTVAASAGVTNQQVLSDTTHTASFAAGDRMSLQCVNNATATSVFLGSVSWQYQ